MKLKIMKLDPKARLPSYAHPGDAGMDLFALEKTILKPGERKVVRTGITMEIPKRHTGLIWDKSGIAIREGLTVLGGVIDCGYRGEILVGTVNLGSKTYTFLPGHKVAQMLIQKVSQVDILEVKSLSKTKRGLGFGSSGK